MSIKGFSKSFIFFALIINSLAIYFVANIFLSYEVNKKITKKLQDVKDYMLVDSKSWFNMLYSDSLLLSEDKAITSLIKDESMDIDQRNNLLIAEIYSKFVNIDILAVINKNGRVIADNIINRKLYKELHKTQWFLESLEGKPTSGTIFYDERFYRLVLMPIFEAEKMLGVVIIGKELNRGNIQFIKNITDVDMIMLEDNQKIGFATDVDIVYKGDKQIFLKKMQEQINRKRLENINAEPQKMVNIEGEKMIINFIYDPQGFLPVTILTSSLNKNLSILYYVGWIIALVNFVFLVVFMLPKKKIK